MKRKADPQMEAFLNWLARKGFEESEAGALARLIVRDSCKSPLRTHLQRMHPEWVPRFDQIYRDWEEGER